jgi:tetratricopeptide (TPR) repeat protein
MINSERKLIRAKLIALVVDVDLSLESEVRLIKFFFKFRLFRFLLNRAVSNAELRKSNFGGLILEQLTFCLFVMSSERGVKFIDRYLANNPENSVARYIRARIFYNVGRWQEAFDDFGRALKLGFDPGKAIVGQFVCLDHLPDTVIARLLETLDIAIDLYPDSADLLLWKRLYLDCGVDSLSG